MSELIKFLTFSRIATRYANGPFNVFYCQFPFVEKYVIQEEDRFYYPELAGKTEVFVYHRGFQKAEIISKEEAHRLIRRMGPNPLPMEIIDLGF